MKRDSTQTTVLFAPFDSSHMDGALAYARGKVLLVAHQESPDEIGPPLLVSIPGMADNGMYFRASGRSLKAYRPSRAFEESLAYALKSKIPTLPEASLLSFFPPNCVVEVLGPGLIVDEVVAKLIDLGFLREKNLPSEVSSIGPSFRLRKLSLDRPDGATSGPLNRTSALKVTRAALKRAKRGEGSLPGVWSMGSQGEALGSYLRLGSYSDVGAGVEEPPTSDTFAKMGYDVSAYQSNSLWLLHDPGEFKLVMDSLLRPLREGKDTGIILYLPGATEVMLQEATRFDEAFHKEAALIVKELEDEGKIAKDRPLKLFLSLVIEAISFDFLLKVLGHPSFEVYGIALEGEEDQAGEAGDV